MARAVLRIIPIAAMLVVAGCGGGDSAETTAAVIAAPADLSGVAVEVHQAPG